MTVTLDHDTGIDAAGATYGCLLMRDLAGMLDKQGFEVREPADADATEG